MGHELELGGAGPWFLKKGMTVLLWPAEGINIKGQRG